MKRVFPHTLLRSKNPGNIKNIRLVNLRKFDRITYVKLTYGADATFQIQKYLLFLTFHLIRICQMKAMLMLTALQWK